MNLTPKDLTPVYKETIGRGAGARRWQRPRLRRSSAALQPRLPGRREHPGLAGAGAGGRLRAGVAEVHGGEPAPRHARARVLPPVRERVQPPVPGSAGVDSFARPLSRRSRQRAGLDDRRRSAHRQARARGRCGPCRPVVRVPAPAVRPRRRDPRRQPRARRHDAVRHSCLSPAARRAGQGNRAHRGDGREDYPQLSGERRAGREGRRFVRRRLPGDWRAGREPSRYSRHGQRQDRGCRHAHGAGREGPRSLARARGRHRRRRQHRDGRRAHRQAARRRGGGADLPLRQGADGGPPLRGDGSLRRRASRSSGCRR